jgi:hypothetical protein
VRNVIPVRCGAGAQAADATGAIAAFRNTLAAQHLTSRSTRNPAQERVVDARCTAALRHRLDSARAAGGSLYQRTFLIATAQHAVECSQLAAQALGYTLASRFIRPPAIAPRPAWRSLMPCCMPSRRQAGGEPIALGYHREK